MKEEIWLTGYPRCWLDNLDHYYQDHDNDNNNDKGDNYDVDENND